ncbi:glucosidase 2 subunit beta-like [Ptychodera flava]|uniref:glucosidase 2 subunit beta-like n=1 Tax=Ptychodera flava TaxID=63121 RepID=UPI00396A26C1
MAVSGFAFVQISRFFRFHVLFSVCFIFIGAVLSQQVQRPRGVSLSNKPFYENKETFTCLDGSLKIPFSLVNDDYCDCKDGTDEPGTAACPRGRFHCTNAGHKPMYIPSSRVNDGICDCCDASDEYDGKVSCENNCKELGREERERRQREIESFNQGFIIRQEYVKEGKDKLEEKKKQLEELREERKTIEALKEEKKAAKEAAEAPEKEAKDRHREAWEKVKEENRQVKQREEALLAFQELDTNNDNVVSADEIQAHLEFDGDNNGEVSYEEALEVLIDDDVSLDLFAKEVWPQIKDKYKPMQQVEEPPTPTEIDIEDVAPGDEEYEDYPEEDEEAYTDDDEDDDDDEDVPPPKQDKDGDAMPPYDDNIQTLIDAANKAREEFIEVDDRYKKMNDQVNELEKILGYDLGREGEFYTIQGQCFEYQDKEYTYKFCPFEKVSQKPKVGRETSLGTWKGWEGPDGRKYSRMKYGGGEKCWNGPDRSTEVILMCGLENKVTKASEPNRCEYELEFTTPALCNKMIDPNSDNTDKHDEL